MNAEIAAALARMHIEPSPKNFVFGRKAYAPPPSASKRLSVQAESAWARSLNTSLAQRKMRTVSSVRARR